uniref:hypothetical protein n=1 Tax=Algoriphagus sp. TaxID=1872435 RepID=UPI004048C6E5
MEEVSYILAQYLSGSFWLSNFHGLERVTHTDEYKEMEVLSNEIIELLFPNGKKFEVEEMRKPAPLKAIINIEKLIKYANLLRHPIHINEFKNKNGNVFYQARASIKDRNGKKVMLNGYIGPSHKFYKGIEDPEAIEIGRKAVLKKLRKFYIN